jgi:hypothetical protein
VRLYLKEKNEKERKEGCGGGRKEERKLGTVAYA